MTVLDRDPFSALPLWGQVLVAARMVQRMHLTGAEELPESDHRHLGGAIAAVCAYALHGGPGRDAEDGFAAMASLHARERPTPLVEAFRQLLGATRAAQAALDFPVDASVTLACRNALRVLATDVRLSSLQMAVLLASDIDLVGHACREFSVGHYDALGKEVLLRLAPVHALTLGERPSTVDEYR